MDAKRVVRGNAELLIEALDDFVGLDAFEGHRRVVAEYPLGVLEIDTDQLDVGDGFQCRAQRGFPILGEKAGDAVSEVLRLRSGECGSLVGSNSDRRWEKDYNSEDVQKDCERFHR